MAQHILQQSSVAKLFYRCPMLQNGQLHKLPGCHNRQVWQQQIMRVSVFEKDKKSGYRKPIEVPKTRMIKEGVKMLGSEMNVWVEEMKERLTCDINVFDIGHGDFEYAWKFHDKESVDDWILTTDHDNSEGFSKANFTFTKNRTGLFHGHLSQQIPKDGIVKRTGYCNIRSPTKCLSFKRETTLDWSPFTHLLLKVRGDGRPYMLTIAMDRFFDVSWNDQYHYTLFTRGGPYWQTAKIPFSKFYVTNKGRIQDKQEPIHLTKVTHLGISVGDGNEGPFYLEVDSIAVMVDQNHKEDFAYESYEANPAHVNT